MSLKIFLIEDDANLLSALEAKFSLAGCRLETEMGSNENIADVLNRIKSFQPDFLILDLVLPRLDSWDFLKSLKGSDGLKHVPVFIFSNLSDSDSRARSEALGVDYYFLKSELDIDSFVNKVIKIIQNRGR